MKRISLDELLKGHSSDTYADQYSYILGRIENDEIRPVKNSNLNGKKPALHESYWLVEEKKDYGELVNELNYEISTRISTDYYRKNLEKYQQDHDWVRMLSSYMEAAAAGRQETLKKISLNERSFQIWGREKFLQKEQGRRILKNCGVSLQQLNVYETTEPLCYYSASKQEPQTILFIENKDTFYSMRRFLIENQPESSKILGEVVQTLVYGAGKGIFRSVEDFRLCVEPYMNNPENRYLYFGDLDYEGVFIYEHLAELFRSEHEIKPFVAAYEKMLSKAEKYPSLPDMKQGQNRNLSESFFTYFSDNIKCKIKEILQEDKYIPQEIVNINDL